MWIALDNRIEVDDAYYHDATDGNGKELHLQACLTRIDSQAEKIDMAKDDAFILMARGRDLRDRQVPLRLKTSRIIWDSFLPNELPNPDLSWMGIVDKDVAYSDAYREDPNTLSCRVVFRAYTEFKVVEQLDRLFVNQEKQKSDFFLDNISIDDGKSIVSTLEWTDGTWHYRERPFKVGESQDAEFYFEAPNKMPLTEI